MSDKIRPSEVSEVLLKQLEGVNSAEQFDEVGTVQIGRASCRERV